MPLLRPGRWPSRLLRVFAGLAVLLAVAGVCGWFFGVPAASRYVERRLKDTVAQQTNARLEIGRLQYHFPYGVRVDDAAFWSATPGEPSIKLAGFEHLDLTLGKLPLRRGPLVIQQVDVRKPTLYLVETKADGFVGLKHLLKDSGQRQTEASPRLSEVLRLRHVQLTDARVEYDDRTISRSVPFVWDKLGFTMNGVPHDSAAPYPFDVTAGNGDTAKVQAAGSLDLDGLVLKLDRLNLSARLVEGERVSPLPAGVQRVLNTLHVAGSGHATVRGVIPVQTASKDLDLTGEFVVDDAQGRLSTDADATPLADLGVTGRIAMHGRQVAVMVDSFACRRGPLGVSIQPVTVNYALPTDRWNTTPVRAAVAYVPPAGADGPLKQRMTALLALTLEELKVRDQFRVRVASSSISLPDTAGVVTVSGSLRYDDDGVAVEQLRLDGLGGPVTLAGVLNDTVTSFNGELDVQKADLDRLNRMVDPDATHALAGVVSGHAAFGVTEGLDAVRGQGWFHVTGGAFARVPVLGGIADALKIGQNAFTAHAADGRFALTPTKVAFERFALSTTVLALVGRGDVGYDGHLNLSVYADGHWKEHDRSKELYIPVLSDIGRALAGAGAYTFGSVSRQFTHVTVTGDLNRPKVTPSPAPVLTENLDKLFNGG